PRSAFLFRFTLDIASRRLEQQFDDVPWDHQLVEGLAWLGREEPLECRTPRTIVGSARIPARNLTLVDVVLVQPALDGRLQLAACFAAQLGERLEVWVWDTDAFRYLQCTVHGLSMVSGRPK